MHKYFIGSYLLTVFGVIAAYFWGEHVSQRNRIGLCIYCINFAVLETSLSFDNAVVNAMKLEQYVRSLEA